MSRRIEHPRDRFIHHAGRILVGILPRFRPNGRIAPVGGEDEETLAGLLSQEVIYGLAVMTKLEHPDNPIHEDYALLEHSFEVGDYLARRFGSGGTVDVKDSSVSLTGYVPPRLLHYWSLAATELVNVAEESRLADWWFVIDNCLHSLHRNEGELWKRAGGLVGNLPAREGLNPRFLSAAILAREGLKRGSPDLLEDGMTWMEILLETIPREGCIKSCECADWYDTWLSAYAVDLYWRDTEDPRAEQTLEKMLDFLAATVLHGGVPPPTLDSRRPAGQATYTGLHTFSRLPHGRALAWEVSQPLAWPDKEWGQDYRTVRRASRLAESAMLWEDGEYEPPAMDMNDGLHRGPPGHAVWKRDSWKACFREVTAGAPDAEDAKSLLQGGDKPLFAMFAVSCKEWGLVAWGDRCGVKRNEGLYRAAYEPPYASASVEANLRVEGDAVALVVQHPAFQSQTWLQVPRPDYLAVHLVVSPRQWMAVAGRLKLEPVEGMEISLLRELKEPESHVLGDDRFRVPLAPGLAVEWRRLWRPGRVRLRVLQSTNPIELVWYASEHGTGSRQPRSKVMFLDWSYPEEGGTVELAFEYLR